jgi:hypothetical protein
VSHSFAARWLGVRWKHIDWDKFRIYVVSNFVRGKFGEPKSAASKKPVVLHSLVMGLLKNWRETTAYAGDEDFIFASPRLSLAAQWLGWWKSDAVVNESNDLTTGVKTFLR